MTDRDDQQWALSDDGRPQDESQMRILAEYIDRLNSGESLDLERVMLDHPDVAPEIVEQLRAFQGFGLEDGFLDSLGEYRLVRRIGRGGMGVVYEAWQQTMDRRVALKVLPGGLLADLKAIARFEREAKIAGKLQHPNIVAVHGMGVDENLPHFAMEYVEGETLAQILSRAARREQAVSEEEKNRFLSAVSSLIKVNGSGKIAAPLEHSEDASRSGLASSAPEKGHLDTDEVNLQYCLNVAAAFAGVAEGLHHAHQKGVIHRDIKPSNLILDKEGRLRILDFGLARLEGQESLTLSADLVGTPLYMSPEQARARKVRIDHRSDVYSVGATMYQMLTWEPPFKGKDHQETLSQIINWDPRPPRGLNPRIPQDLENIVLKCLRKVPADRYATAEALAQDLRRFVRGDQVEARPQPTWEKLQRRLRRHQSKVLLVLSLLLCAASSGLLLHKSMKEQQEIRLVRYSEQIIDAAMLLQMGELILNAAVREPGSIDSQDLFQAGDFQAMVDEAGMNPLEQAVAELEEAQAILPGRPEAYYHCARAMMLLRRDESALANLRRALQAEPSFAPGRALLGELGKRRREPQLEPAQRDLVRTAETVWEPLWQAAQEAMQRQDWKACAAAYSTLLKYFSDKPEPYLGAAVEFCLGRGRALLEARDLPGAVESFVAARTLWPRAKVPGLLLGKVYLEKGEREQAESTFQALHDESAKMQDEVVLWVAAIYKYFREYERGLKWTERLKQPSLRQRLQIDFHNLLGRFDDAIRLGREAISRFPDDALMHHFLAVALLRNPRTQKEGLDVAKRAVDLDPKNADTVSLLATAHQVNGDPELAEALFMKTIENAPEEARAYDHLGRLLRASGRLKEAEERFRQAISVLGKRPRQQFLSPHNNLGNVLLAQGRLEASLEAYRAAIEFDPRLALSHGNLGIVFKRLGNLDEAGQNLRRAIELDSRDPKTHRLLGLVLFLQGRTADAESSLRKAVQLEPKYWQAASDLGWVLESQGKHGDAFATYAGALRTDLRNKGAHEALVSLQLRKGEDSAFEEGWDAVAETIEGADESLRVKPGILNTLAVARAHGRAERDIEKACELALEAVKATQPQRPEFLFTLAEIESLRGHKVECVRILEEAARLPRALRIHEERLQVRRKEILPRFISFASIDACLAVQEDDGQNDAKVIDAFERVAAPEDTRLLEYLRGRVLQRARKYGEAAEQFVRVEDSGETDPAPVLRAAECLRASGATAMAELRLRRAIEAGFQDDREVWHLWLATCFTDMKLSAARVLELMPPGEVAVTSSTPTRPQAPARYAADVRWLLERLARHEPVHINCGGDDYQDSSGWPWSKDRFFVGGLRRPAVPYEIAGTDDDALFQVARWFPADEPCSGYQIPLPPGKYRVSLSFAEVSLWDRTARLMDVVVEGQRVLRGYNPMSAGFAMADRHDFLTVVEDGILQIQFDPMKESAMVSALRLEAVQ